MNQPLPELPQQKIDLVDFDDVKLLMPRFDCLYRGNVADERKNGNLTEYARQTEKNGFPRSHVTPENVHRETSARYCIQIYLNHLWENGVDFDIFDVGSHVGDFSMKMGNFVRTFNKPARVIAFEPTFIGTFIPYNIRINGLQEIVHFEPYAVSDVNGLIMFRVQPGYSDRSSAFTGFGLPRKWNFALLKNIFHILMQPKEVYYQIRGKLNAYNVVARSVTLLEYLSKNNLKRSLFFKLDIEGLDAAVIESLWPRITQDLVSLVTEFTPSGFTNNTEAGEYLKKLSEYFVIYDILYSPNPTRCERIEESKLMDFPTHIQTTREHQYTDLMLIPKRVPNLDKLIQRLDGLTKSPDAYVL